MKSRHKEEGKIKAKKLTTNKKRIKNSIKEYA